MNAQFDLAAQANRVLAMVAETDLAAARRHADVQAAALKLEEEIDRCMAALVDLAANARDRRGAA